MQCSLLLTCWHTLQFANFGCYFGREHRILLFIALNQRSHCESKKNQQNKFYSKNSNSLLIIEWQICTSCPEKDKKNISKTNSSLTYTVTCELTDAPLESDSSRDLCAIGQPVLNEHFSRCDGLIAVIDTSFCILKFIQVCEQKIWFAK